MPAKANMQDEYLRNLITARSPVRVLLVNGKDLRGLVKACDAFTVILDIGGAELLVYKSAIAVIGPQSRANE
jgi:host factor-I protein